MWSSVRRHKRKATHISAPKLTSSMSLRSSDLSMSTSSSMPRALVRITSSAAQKRRISPRLNSLNLGPRGSGPTPAVVYMSCKADMYPSTEFTVCPRVKYAAALQSSSSETVRGSRSNSWQKSMNWRCSP